MYGLPFCLWVQSCTGKSCIQVKFFALFCTIINCWTTVCWDLEFFLSWQRNVTTTPLYFVIFTQPTKKNQYCVSKAQWQDTQSCIEMDWEEEESSAKNHLVENSDERAGGVGLELPKVDCVSAEGVLVKGCLWSEEKRAIPLHVTSRNRKWALTKSSVGYNMGWGASQSSG